MKIPLLLFLSVLSAPAGEIGYVDKMIACKEGEESFVSEAFDAFLTLVSHREVKKNSLHFSAQSATFREDYIIFDRAFYISPNNLRGFELAVPKNCITENNGVLTLSDTVVLDSESYQGDIRIFVLKKK